MRFFRKLLIFAMVVCPLLFAFGVYMLKYKSVYYAEAIARTKSAMKQERSAMAVLRAEIAYLEQPNLITLAAHKYLQLKPMSVAQITSLKDLPKKSADEDLIGAHLSGASVSRVEQNKTPAVVTPTVKGKTR